MATSNKRVVSLISSATEIVSALGCAHWIVGRSHECDFPPSVSNLLVCTEPKIEVNGTSTEIDARVKEAVGEGLSVYRVFPERLDALSPDIIFTQSQCEVCAVSLKDVEEAVCDVVSSSPEVVSLEPNCLEDVFEDIVHVAVRLGIAATGSELADDLRNRVEDIAARATDRAELPTVACIEWIDPLMAAGNWVPELVDFAGGTNLFGEAGLHSPWMAWEDLVLADPEFIFVMPCGWDMGKGREELRVLGKNPGWPKLRAVRDGRVFLTDGNHYFNRSGPRLVESLEILAEVLHPDVFRFGHRGTGWEPL